MVFNSISPEDGEFLSREVENDEIDLAVRNCDSSKAPGPDGFNFNFIKRSWDIIKHDMYDFVRKFWSTEYMPSELNTAYVTLIPKKTDASELKDFRPISLVGCAYKIVSKIMALRLKRVMNKLIGEQQSAFVHGRQILDSVLIANEIIDSYKRSGEQALLFKVDFHKAYDSISWQFLLWVMQKMGFPSKWCRLIKSCLSTSSIAVLINGTPSEPFLLQKGLRQGDPLSPFLFNIVAEALNCLIGQATRMGEFEGLKISRNGPISVSHLQFADDTIFFCKANRDQIINIKKLLILFHLASGLKVNFHKSSIVGINTETPWLRELANDMRCNNEELPIQYLGLPLGDNPKKKTFWQPVLHKMEKAMSSWGGKLLSIGGRVTLIKAVLANMPTYYLSLFEIPKSVASQIVQMQKRFLWSGVNENLTGGKALVNWDIVDAPKELGGLGIGNVLAKNISLLFKWIWRLASDEESLWKRLVHEKYNIQRVASLADIPVPRNGGPWKGVCRAIMTNPKAVEVANVGIRKKVGNGQSIKFWTDLWVDNLPLRTRFPRLYSVSSQKEASICQLGFSDGLNWQWCLDWRRELYTWEVSQLNVLLELLKNVDVDEAKSDGTIWSLTSSGKFTTRSFYLAYMRKTISREMQVINGLWKGLVPPKVEIFVWLVCLKRIHTKDRLIRMNIIRSNEGLCVLCRKEDEDSNHLFLHCEFSRKIWNNWLSQWGVKWVWRESVKENFEAWKSPWKDKGQSKIWVASFFVILWSIWKERNARVFNDVAISLERTKELVWVRLAWWVKGWDDEFQYSIDDVLRNPNCILWSTRKVIGKSEVTCEWEPPIEGEMKWNVDASISSEGESIYVAIGGALRDHNKAIKCLFYKEIQQCEINEAEFQAIWEVIKLTKEQDWLKQYDIIVESDSSNAVKWCNEEDKEPWKVNFLTNKIRKAIRESRKIRIQHKSRESNYLADSLAKTRKSKSEDFIAWL